MPPKVDLSVSAPAAPARDLSGRRSASGSSGGSSGVTPGTLGRSAGGTLRRERRERRLGKRRATFASLGALEQLFGPPEETGERRAPSPDVIQTAAADSGPVRARTPTPPRLAASAPVRSLRRGTSSTFDLVALKAQATQAAQLQLTYADGELEAREEELLRIIKTELCFLRDYYTLQYEVEFPGFVSRLKKFFRNSLSDRQIELLQQRSVIKKQLKPLAKVENISTQSATDAYVFYSSRPGFDPYRHAQILIEDILQPLQAEQKIAFLEFHRAVRFVTGDLEDAVEDYNRAFDGYNKQEKQTDEHEEDLEKKGSELILYWYDFYHRSSGDEKKKAQRRLEKIASQTPPRERGFFWPVFKGRRERGYLWHVITGRRDKYFRKRLEADGYLAAHYTGLGYSRTGDQIAYNPFAQLANDYGRHFRVIKLKYAQQCFDVNSLRSATSFSAFFKEHDILETCWDRRLEAKLAEAIRNGKKINLKWFDKRSRGDHGEAAVTARTAAREMTERYNRSIDRFYNEKFAQVQNSFDYTIHELSLLNRSWLGIIGEAIARLMIFDLTASRKIFHRLKLNRARHTRCSSVIDFLQDFETLLHATPDGETQPHGQRLIQEFKNIFFDPKVTKQLSADKKRELLNAWHQQLIAFVLDLQKQSRLKQIQISEENLRTFKKRVNHIAEQLQLDNALIRDPENPSCYISGTREALTREKALRREHKLHANTTAKYLTPVVAFGQGCTAVLGWLNFCILIGICVAGAAGAIVITGPVWLVLGGCALIAVLATGINLSLFRGDLYNALVDLFVDAPFPFFVPASMKGEATWVKWFTGFCTTAILVGAAYSAVFVYKSLLVSAATFILALAGITATASLVTLFAVPLAALTFVCLFAVFFVSISKFIKYRFHLRLLKFLGITFLPHKFDEKWMFRTGLGKFWFVFFNVSKLLFGLTIVGLIVMGNYSRFRTWLQVSSGYVEGWVKNSPMLQGINVVLCAVASGLWFIFGSRHAIELTHRLFNFIQEKIFGRIKPEPILTLNADSTYAEVGRQLLAVEQKGKYCSEHGLKIDQNHSLDDEKLIRFAEQYAKEYSHFLQTFNLEGFDFGKADNGHARVLQIILTQISALNKTENPALTRKLAFKSANLMGINSLLGEYLPSQINSLTFESCTLEKTSFDDFINQHPQIKYLTFDQTSFEVIANDCKDFALKVLHLSNFDTTAKAVAVHPDTEKLEFENVPVQLVDAFLKKNAQVNSLNLKNIQNLNFNKLFKNFTAANAQLTLHELTEEDAIALQAELESVDADRFIHLNLVNTSKASIKILSEYIRHNNKRILLTTPEGAWHTSKDFHLELTSNPRANYLSPALRWLSRVFGYVIAPTVNALGNAVGYASNGDISFEQREEEGASAFTVSFVPNMMSFFAHMQTLISPMKKEDSALIASKMMTRLNETQTQRQAILGKAGEPNHPNAPNKPDTPNNDFLEVQLPTIDFDEAVMLQIMHDVSQTFGGQVKSVPQSSPRLNKPTSQVLEAKDFSIRATSSSSLRLQGNSEPAVDAMTQMVQRIVAECQGRGESVIPCVRSNNPALKQQLETALREAGIETGNYDAILRQQQAEAKLRMPQSPANLFRPAQQTPDSPTATTVPSYGTAAHAA